MAPDRNNSRRRGRLTIAAGFLGVILCITGPAGAAGENGAEILLLADWLTGRFSNAVQAAEDPEVVAVDLNLAAIWPERTDGRWLYVEQAMAELPNRPYRQRVYRLHEPAPGLFEIRVFALIDAMSVLGAWRDEEPLVEIAIDDLVRRDGCEVLLRRRGDAFVGSTIASMCRNSLRGAAFTTSEVLITADGFISWDRGFSDDGRQVWGPTDGGYVFDRIVEDNSSESTSAPGSESAPAPDPAPDPDPE